MPISFAAMMAVTSPMTITGCFRAALPMCLPIDSVGTGGPGGGLLRVPKRRLKGLRSFWRARGWERFFCRSIRPIRPQKGISVLQGHGAVADAICKPAKASVLAGMAKTVLSLLITKVKEDSGRGASLATQRLR